MLGQKDLGHSEIKFFPITKKLVESDSKNKLVKDIKLWADWVLEKSEKELGELYENETKGCSTMCNFWSRTITCQNPNCKCMIPLLMQFWLCNTKRKKIALFPFVDKKEIKFKVVGDGYDKIPSNFNPSEGTVKRAKVRCLKCGYTIEPKTLRNLFQNGMSTEKMIAVVYVKNNSQGKFYRLPTNHDFKIFEKASSLLKKKISDSKEIPTLIPDEELPLMSGTFNVPLYGIKKWGDLFNNRQKLTLSTLSILIKQAYDQMLKQKYEKDYAKAVTTYLAFLLDKITAASNTCSTWDPTRESMHNIFGRQSIGMIWDYGETNILSGKSRSFSELLKDILKVIEVVTFTNKPAQVTNFSAIKLPYNNEYFDVMHIDPPYYNSVPYSDLSDFFYVWLKRSIKIIIS